MIESYDPTCCVYSSLNCSLAKSQVPLRISQKGGKNKNQVTNKNSDGLKLKTVNAESRHVLLFFMQQTLVSNCEMLFRLEDKGKRWRFIVWCLVQSGTCPTSHNYPRSQDLFIHKPSQLLAGSIQPGCHFRRTELFKHTSLHCPDQVPTYSWVERVHVWAKCLA